MTASSCIPIASARASVAWLLAAALIAGCGGGQARLRPLTESSVVVAFGDSLTFGTGADNPELAYPAVLAERLRCRVINAGVPGEATAEGLARLPDVLDRHRPDLVLLCEGGNDFLQGTPQQAVEENLRRMLRLLRTRGVGVVLIGVPRPGLTLRTAPLYEALAREFRVPYEGEAVRQVLRNPGLKSDPLHPNDEGYQRLAEALAKRIRQAAR